MWFRIKVALSSEDWLFQLKETVREREREKKKATLYVSYSNLTYTMEIVHKIALCLYMFRYVHIWLYWCVLTFIPMHVVGTKWIIPPSKPYLNKVLRSRLITITRLNMLQFDCIGRMNGDDSQIKTFCLLPSTNSMWLTICNWKKAFEMIFMTNHNFLFVDQHKIQ